MLRQAYKAITYHLLNTFSRVLMLFALRMSKVAYVGALKQLSLFFGATLGWLLLKEHMGKYRIIGLVFIVFGAGFSYSAR